ncbi:MAG: GNAT family N-acetyltransferase [Rickettsiaceae bacterium]|nr:GNAT family N-acetyltransferase [Rickettsiaceae bacterium]
MKPILIDFPMPIITPRLLLRPPQLGDGTALNAAVVESFDNIKQTMPWAKEKPSLEESEEFVRQSAANWILKKNEEPYLPLFIFSKEDNSFIGATGFHHIAWEVPCLETGYWISNKYASQGYMTEAINAITRYAIKYLQVKRIVITCDSNNIRSKKIPEKLGYELEAILKANRIKPTTGEISDTLVFAKFDLINMPDLNVRWPDDE